MPGYSQVQIFKGVFFDSKWENTVTSGLDLIADSWYKIRDRVNNSSDENGYLIRVKRKHAIETGIVERLYTLSRGVTETLIESGFEQSLISHGESDIPARQLIAMLNSQYAAIELVFGYIKDERPFSENSIQEIHTMLVENQRQSHAQDSTGKIVEIELKGGAYKTSANNPVRADGTQFNYCAPELVASEMGNMMDIYRKLEPKMQDGSVHPVKVAAWLHHAFTTIHPFPDGNGRVARLLATFVLLKYRYLPFTLVRENKLEYIDALENADNGNPESLVNFFCANQKKLIEDAINDEPNYTRPKIMDVGARLRNISDRLSSDRKNREDKILADAHRTLEALIVRELDGITEGLKSAGTADMLDWEVNVNENSGYYYNQVVHIAIENKYFFNKQRPKSWYRIKLSPIDGRTFDIVFTLHHFGYADNSVSFGCFITDRIDKANYRITPNGTYKHSLQLKPDLLVAHTEALVNYIEESIEHCVVILETWLLGSEGQ